jgi:hypothetical protein
VQQAKRESIIAVLLWKFALFTQWPEVDAAEPAPDAENEPEPFFITVLGEDTKLEAALLPYGGKTINGRLVKINRVNKTRDVQGAHVVFVCPQVKLSAKERSQLISVGTLLCSTQKGFAEGGGMIEFVLKSGAYPQFEINQSTLKAARLEVRARILAMASRVIQEEPPQVAEDR